MLLAILGAVVKTKDNIAKGPRAVRDVEVRDGGTVLDEGNGDGAVTDVEGSEGAAAGVDVALVGRIGEGRRYEQEGQEKQHFFKKKTVGFGNETSNPFFFPTISKGSRKWKFSGSPSRSSSLSCRSVRMKSSCLLEQPNGKYKLTLRSVGCEVKPSRKSSERGPPSM